MAELMPRLNAGKTPSISKLDEISVPLLHHDLGETPIGLEVPIRANKSPAYWDLSELTRGMLETGGIRKMSLKASSRSRAEVMAVRSSVCC